MWNCPIVDQNTKADKRGIASRLPRMRLSSAWISRAEGRSGSRSGRASRRQRLVHDPPDGTRAPPALGAAAEATIDLAGRAPRLRRRNRTHVMVDEPGATAPDHGRA